MFSLKTFVQAFSQKKEDTSRRFSLNRLRDNIQNALLSFRLVPNMLPRFSTGKKPFLLGLGFLLILLIAGFSLWWFYPKATVTVYVSPKKLEERIELTVDVESDSSSFADNTLSGKVIETSVSGEQTRDTTGTKTVGEKAKGEVTIYRVGSQMTLPAGTVLNGPGSLKFALDNAVNIASGSAGTPGTTKAFLSAEDIGPEYNLASGTTFSVGNYGTSDLEAKNESAFSGGTSREISAVSKEDQEALLDELERELEGKAKSDLEAQVSAEKYFIEESLEAVSSAQSYSHKVGDETGTLKLSLTLEAKGVLVEKNELVQLVQENLQVKVPEGFVLRGEQISFNFDEKEVSGNEYSFVVRVSANLLPEVDTESISKMIRGRYPKIAEEYLIKEVPGFVRAEIRIKPSFSGKLTTLPHVIGNIDVEVAAER